MTDRNVLEAIRRALRQETHHIAAQPEFTWQQLHNRLQWEGDEVRAMLLSARLRRAESDPRPWARTCLRARDAALRRVLVGHLGSVNDCAWSADGSRVASAGSDHTLRIWDAVTGVELHQLTGHGGPVTACAWSPDGADLVSASEDRTLWLWDASSGEPRRALAGGSSFATCGWSPDGTRVGSLADGDLRVWDAATGDAVPAGESPGEQIAGWSWSPDGCRVFIASRTGSIHIWEATTGAHVDDFELLGWGDEDRSVTACAWSPDTRRVLWALEDGYAAFFPKFTLHVWDEPIEDDEFSVIAGETEITHCAWSPSGSRVLSVSGSTVRVWDAETGAGLRLLTGHGDSITTCAWSPDGSQAVSASSDGTLRMWDVGDDAETGSDEAVASSIDLVRVYDQESAEEYFVEPDSSQYVEACAWSPDGMRIASAYGDGALRVFDAIGGQRQRVLVGHRSEVFACAWSPDGERLASVGLDERVRIWSANDGESDRDLQLGEFHSCAWSPDGTRVLVGSMSDHLAIWWVAWPFGHPGRVTEFGSDLHPIVAELDGHDSWVSDCGWSPDGTRVVSAGSERTIRVWDAATGRQLHELREHADAVRACAWSPDGTMLASASSDHTLRIWDAITGEQRHEPMEHSDAVTACAWSPSGTRVASTDGRNLRVWDVASGESCGVLPLHWLTINAWGWSPDGARLIFTCRDESTIRIWDVTTRQETVDKVHADAARFLALHPWWPMAIAVGDDGYVHVFELVGVEYRPPVVTARPRDGSPTVRCPVCGHEHPIPDSCLGSDVACNRCGSLLRVGPSVVHYHASNQWCQEIGDRAEELRVADDWREALALHEQIARVCRDLGRPENLAISLYNQAAVYAEHDTGEAVSLLQEARQLATSHGLDSVTSIVDALREELTQ